MKLRKLSLRVRIFLAMILLIVLASVLIAAVAIYQYSEETQDYHKQRLERKEQSIKTHLGYILSETTYPRTTEKVPLIFKEKIFEISNIHHLRINIYDLEGNLLISSEANIRNEFAEKCLDAEILNTLSNTAEHRFVNKREEKGATFRSSYSYLLDNRSKNLAIINLPYLENDEFLAKELEEFLERLAYTYILMLLIAIALAYLLSKYITKSIKTIGDRIKATRLEKRNEKIKVGQTSEEISNLVDSYNSMIDELEESAVKLARSEREQAWREMAKQVAHEIKNPLTPMRLSVQSFQRKFDPTDSNIHNKVDEYTKTLIQQIDTMSSIASAFSNFAKMPAQQNEMLDVVETTKLALDIFNEHYISFDSQEEKIIAKFDRTQLIRVITNLIKNGIQAIPIGKEDPKIRVQVISKKGNVNIIVTDNGIGITEEYKPKIFEPKFTTKTSGMGLGLAMVKNIVETYNGSINFTSEYGQGTTFTVTFPKE
ncbi:ATP-binding protein [Ichthyenterobacterium sp. W332]|uniref:histidine kinase n=1 Tax=Microcosmobacter mediterraneus TaxID=3075607 RepID=A0ABU2YI16_9FLAO|nr:ATP-binding protein [Ichthyenterobacterium sp. W332]MDT0557812.1 ATP-binding protein [Ichthyenterobacterium sp. W332]